MSVADGVATYRAADGVAVLTINSPPVNALSHAVRIALDDGVERALQDDAAQALVLICAGRTFFAGADVTELDRPILPPLLADLMARFEASTKPIVAAMHGTALGGGFELALAAHYRVAVPSAVVGLPEVALGLLPGAGGTQRVPRLIGIAAAIELIGLGRRVRAPEAVDFGLIDAVVPEGELEPQAVAFAQRLMCDGAPLRRVRDLKPDLGPDEACDAFARFRIKHPQLFVGLKAADGVLRAIEAAVCLPFDEGLARERAISRELMDSPESAAQRHLFFAERAAAKLPGFEKEKPAPGKVEIVETDGVAQIIVDVGTAAAAAAAAIAAMAERRAAGQPAIFVAPAPGLVVERLQTALADAIAALVQDGVPAGDVAATGRAFGLRDALLPTGSGSASGAIEQRLLAPVLATALALVSEGVVKRSSDVDYAAVRAGLWPLWRGGPAYMAERAAAIAADMPMPSPA